VQPKSGILHGSEAFFWLWQNPAPKSYLISPTYG